MTKSFQDLKDALCSTPFLTCPTNDSLFILDTNASQFGVGAALSERDSDNKEKLICYASNRLKKVSLCIIVRQEKNYWQWCSM